MFSNDLKLIEIAVIISGIVIFREVKSLGKYKKKRGWVYGYGYKVQLYIFSMVI